LRPCVTQLGFHTYSKESNAPEKKVVLFRGRAKRKILSNPIPYSSVAQIRTHFR
jgi:hypothetical protein